MSTISPFEASIQKTYSSSLPEFSFGLERPESYEISPFDGTSTWKATVSPSLYMSGGYALGLEKPILLDHIRPESGEILRRMASASLFGYTVTVVPSTDTDSK